MGDSFQTIVDRDASLVQAESLAKSIREWLVDEQVVVAELTDCVLGSPGGHAPGPRFDDVLVKPDTSSTRQLCTNGLEIVVGRTVFHAGGIGFGLVCQHCGKRLGEGGNQWTQAMDEWCFERGPAVFVCPSCGQGTGVADWI